MKLSEALILRADAQKRLAQIRERFARSAKVQEGEQPPEDPNALLDEHTRTAAAVVSLIQRINRTNASSAFDATRTITDAIAERDGLVLQQIALRQMINLSAPPDVRYGRSEIKYIATIDVALLQRQLDDVSRRYRELDMALQAKNWEIDLLE